MRVLISPPLVISFRWFWCLSKTKWQIWWLCWRQTGTSDTKTINIRQSWWLCQSEAGTSKAKANNIVNILFRLPIIVLVKFTVQFGCWRFYVSFTNTLIIRLASFVLRNRKSLQLLWLLHSEVYVKNSYMTAIKLEIHIWASQQTATAITKPILLLSRSPYCYCY